jgi:hypothetical protein
MSKDRLGGQGRRFVAMAALGFAGLTGEASAVTLPTCVNGVTCQTFADFNVFSLPLLNLQATGNATPGPGDPFFVSSTFGQIQNFTIVGINNGQSTTTGNPPGSVDGSYNTPSANNAANTTFSTLTATDPGGTGEFLGDKQTWDAKVSALLQLSQGTPLTFYFAFNETGSGTGLDTTDLLVWAKATAINYDAQGNVLASKDFFLSADGSTITPDVTNLPAADGSDANGSAPGSPSGFGPWVYVHAGICASATGVFLGFPDVNGNCASGSVRNQNNLGQNAAAFAVDSPTLDAALLSGQYNTLSITWEMAYINGGGETLFILPTSGPTVVTVPEPDALGLLAIGILGLALAAKRRRRV